MPPISTLKPPQQRNTSQQNNSNCQTTGNDFSLTTPRARTALVSASPLVRPMCAQHIAILHDTFPENPVSGHFTTIAPARPAHYAHTPKDRQRTTNTNFLCNLLTSSTRRRGMWKKLSSNFSLTCVCRSGKQSLIFLNTSLLSCEHIEPLIHESFEVPSLLCSHNEVSLSRTFAILIYNYSIDTMHN